MALERVKRNRIVEVVLAVQKRYGADTGGYLAATITYYGFFAILGLTVLALSVLGFVLAGDPTAQAEWEARLSGSFPGVGPFVGDQLGALSRDAGIFLAVGLVGLLVAGVGAIEASGWTLNRIFRVPPRQGFLKLKLWALRSLALLGLLAVSGTAAASVVAALPVEGPAVLGLAAAGAVASFIADFALFMIAYRILVHGRGPSFRDLRAGSAFAALAWTALKVFGSWYLARVISHSTAVYGTFGTVVGVLVFLYLAARLFVYGAELNAVLIERRGESTTQEALDPGGDAVTTKDAPGPAAVNGRGTRSTPELLRAIATDTTTLVRKEIELAKLELSEAVSARIKAAVAFGVVGVFALFAFLFLAAAGAAALDLVLPRWAAWLIVAAPFVLGAVFGLLFAKRRMKVPSMSPEETKRTVKEDIKWAKAQLKR